MLKLGEAYAGEQNIQCPCGSDYLHHIDVEVFDRREDEKSGLHVLISEKTCLTRIDNLPGNPSARRHGFVSRLRCEQCDRTLILTIAQHKGISLIDIKEESKL